MYTITRFECPECSMYGDYMLGLVRLHQKGCSQPEYEWISYVRRADIQDWLNVHATIYTEYLLDSFKKEFGK